MVMTADLPNEQAGMDQWKVEVLPRRHLRIRLPRTTILMNNHLSIGVDAPVTYNFHTEFLLPQLESQITQ